MAEYKTDKQHNYGWTLSFDMVNKAPVIAKRIWNTYEEALAYVRNDNDNAVVGLTITIINDTDTSKNGVYFVKSIGVNGEIEKIGAGDFSVDETSTPARLLINGKTTEDPETHESSYKRYFVGLTELAPPSVPGIQDATDYALTIDVVTGNGTPTVNDIDSGATAKYMVSETKVGGEWVFSGSFSDVPNDNKILLASDFSNSTNNSNREYGIKLKAVKNGEESDEVVYTVTLHPKVAAGKVTITRGQNDNAYSTSGIVTIKLSATTGAINEYSTNGGTSWNPFTEAEIEAGKKEIPISASVTAGTYKVRATKTGYAGSVEDSNLATTLNKKKAYIGIGPASLANEAAIKALRNNNTVVSGLETTKPTGERTIVYVAADEGNYVWICCESSISSVTGAVGKELLEVEVTVDGWKCRRLTNKIDTAGTYTFTIA